MTTEPLNVRVARATGWLGLHIRGGKPAGGVCPCDCGKPCGDILIPGDRWAGRAPGNVLLGHEGVHDDVPPYGEDSPEGWACTGPLIARYGITFDVGSIDSETGRVVTWDAHETRLIHRDGRWWFDGKVTDLFTYGDSAPEAACLLILALHEAGRLKP